ncbi:HAD family hydrolase [Candidatus Accumulibacter sp. ACC003]|uniref:histidinol-phosphatase n=1 Tax=Candidatus Accumulibacter sp. ACC003 TaxID=2823334 RepID=UPI0025C5A45B|nr:HAD family hydrolase [Candidatus Accumulibacter sp. ACC003]
MDLVLFDLDNTLIAGDSDFEWAQFLIAKGVLERGVYETRNIEFYEQYKAGTLDINAFLDFQLRPLARHPRSVLDAWLGEFMTRHIVPIVGAKARALVRQHLDSGALCAIVTATNSFVTAPLLRELGVAHLIATIPAHENGQFTGFARGTPSFREGKVKRVDDWLEAMGMWWGSFERSWFYSDSQNDLPLLSRVSNPVAVDPDPTLRARAEAAGWPILSLLS